MTVISRVALPFALGLALLLSACDSADLPEEAAQGPDPQIPEPSSGLVPTVNVAKGTSWEKGDMPTPGKGLKVMAFAGGLDHPRWLYVLPNGDVLVAETNGPTTPDAREGLRGWIMGKVMTYAGAGVPSANRITLLRDADGDGKAEKRSLFLEGLKSPFGMTLVDDTLYVANTDAVVGFPYEEGDTKIAAEGKTLAELPAGPINYHWTKSLTASPDGKTLYVGVGSNSNIGENGMEAEKRRAAILEIDTETGKSRVYASGLRNPVGLAFAPGSDQLWAVVNERDELGSDLVPDYLTSVKEGGFYGWPYSYWGKYVDERVEPQKPELVEKAIVPDYALGNHVAPLGLAFSEGGKLPAPYSDGAFVGLHGSWNRAPLAGYKVIIVPFSGGVPQGKPVDVLTGFLNDDEDEARGRPVGVVIDNKGALLVADDVGNTVWRVTGENLTANESASEESEAVAPSESEKTGNGGAATAESAPAPAEAEEVAPENAEADSAEAEAAPSP